LKENVKLKFKTQGDVPWNIRDIIIYIFAL